MGAEPVAAIDVGSNTVHVAVARVETEPALILTTLADETEVVRLGADVNATGRIGEERAALAIRVVRSQVALARSLGAKTVLGIATEGVRAAANAQQFLDAVRAETGVAFALVSGDQEAALTYWGATSGAPDGRTRRAVIDLGGGSLELVIGRGPTIDWRSSLPLGSGLIHDRYTPSDPPDGAELAAARTAAEAVLRALDLPLPVAEALASGGSANTLLRLALAAQREIGTTVAGTTLSRDTLHALLALVSALSAEQIFSRYGVDVERARLLGAGCVVLLAAMDVLGVSTLEVSRRGIREGAILAYTRCYDNWLECASRGAW